jgi:cytidine deaminase
MYGENQHKGNCTDSYKSVHAEENAINKLRQLPRHKKNKRVDLLVIRVNKSGTLGSSKPCIHCLLRLYSLLPEKGYILDTIYYSNREGIIENATLTNLLNSEEFHMTRYYKERNMSVK